MWRDLPGLALTEQGERLYEDASVTCRDDAWSAPRSERATGPVRHHPAGALDHRHERTKVVQAMTGFDDEIDEAACEQAEGVAVPAPVLHLRGVAHTVEGRELALGEPVGSCGAERCLGDAGARANPGGCAVKKRGCAGGSDPTIAERRMLDDAEHRPSPVHQTNQRREGRLPQDEGLRAVDGVEHPNPL